MALVSMKYLVNIYYDRMVPEFYSINCLINFKKASKIRCGFSNTFQA